MKSTKNMQWTNKVMTSDVIETEDGKKRILLYALEVEILFNKFKEMDADAMTIWLNKGRYTISIGKKNQQNDELFEG